MLEAESRYSTLLLEKFVNPKEYQEMVEFLERALRITDISAEVLKPFRDSIGFYIYLPPDLNESVITGIAHDRKLLVPLYIGLKKSKLDAYTRLSVFRDNIDSNLLRIIDQFEQDAVPLDKVGIDEYKSKLREYKLSPLLLKTIHSASLGARCEYLLPDMLKDLEQQSFKKIQDLLRIPLAYVKYLSDNSIVRIVRTLSAKLDETEKLTLDEIKELDMFAARVNDQLKNLYGEATKELRETVLGEIIQAGSQGILARISTLFTRLQRMLLGHLFHISDYVERKKRDEIVIEDITKLKTASASQFRKLFTLSANSSIEEFYEELAFFLNLGDFTKDEWKLFTDSLFKNLEANFRKAKNDAAVREDLNLLENYEKRGVFGADLDFKRLHEAYLDFFRKEIGPLVWGNKLLSLVEIWPPRDYQCKKYKISDLVNFGEIALPKSNVLYPKKPADSKIESYELVEKFLRSYYRTVTILCYDIRGSTYMGAKLQNAEKERKIKYKFSLEMSNIVRKYGGFLLKDTGDGGIAWFGDNSKALYERSYTESMTGKGYKLRYSIFSGGEFDLLPAEDSAKRAILCGQEMVRKAEEFIKANFIHYREWFGELKEREVEVEGITYALLPPAFRSLFRIGVGIASGLPGRDVVFGLNSFGDPDLVGPLLADANFFSMGKEPTRSVIITDLFSVINLIANIEHYDFVGVKGGADYAELAEAVSKIRQGERGYNLTDFAVSIKKLGTYYLIQEEKERAVVYDTPKDLTIDDTGNLRDNDNKKLKLLFEIVPQETK